MQNFQVQTNTASINTDTNSDQKPEDVLAALQNHYDVLNKTQQLYIDFLTEYIDNLKKLQQKDRASLDELKQKVLQHILQK